MKKLFTSIFLFVAIASFGGTALNARAADLTPAQAAVLQQTLDSLRAKLFELRAKAAAEAALSGTPSVSGVPLTLKASPAPAAAPKTLSEEEIAAAKTALSSLSGALASLQATLAENPDLASRNAKGISLALTGIGNSLSLIGASLSGSQVSSGLIAASQGTPAPAKGAPAQGSGSAVPSAAGEEITPKPLVAAQGSDASAPAAVSDKAAQVAQVGSAWSWQKNVNWPLVAVIVLVVAAIALWLFWPSEEEEPRRVSAKGPSPASMKSVSVPEPVLSATLAKSSMPAAPTPMSSAVAAPGVRK